MSSEPIAVLRCPSLPDWDSTKGFPGEGPWAHLLSQNASGMPALLRHFREDFTHSTLLAVQETWVGASRNSFVQQGMPHGLIFGGSDAIPSDKGGRHSAGVGFVWAKALPVCNPGALYRDPADCPLSWLAFFM
jgi:hypothetical protein